MSHKNTKSRAFSAPRRYIQGPHEFYNIKKYTAEYGKKICFLIDSFLFDEFDYKLSEIFHNASSEYTTIKFTGECCEEVITEIVLNNENVKSNVFVGIGSGKTIDTAKICADELDIPLIIIPTSVSTDAPVSEISVLYTHDGIYIGSHKNKKSADVVLLDSEIIIKAPKRMFIAGIGDALATWFESRACFHSGGLNYIGEGYRGCLAGLAISHACYETIMKDGLNAINDLESGNITEAYENIIEANTLLSGLGFCNVGLSIAHGVHSGLTALPESHLKLHGEKVSFGLVCQLVLENTADKELDQVLSFMVSIGLPVSLEELNISNTEENILKLAQSTCKNNIAHNEPFEINEQIMFQAIIDANNMGKKYLNKD